MPRVCFHLRGSLLELRIWEFTRTECTADKATQKRGVEQGVPEKVPVERDASGAPAPRSEPKDATSCHGWKCIMGNELPSLRSGKK